MSHVVDVSCKCQVCGWPLDSVESLQKHYGYHLDDFKTTIKEHPDRDELKARIISTSSKYSATYYFPSGRRRSPYPRLEPVLLDHAPRKPILDMPQNLSMMSLDSNISWLSSEYQQKDEPQRKRQRQEKAALEQVVRSRDAWGSFTDYLLDAQLVEFKDVSARDKEFASVWNYYRGRKRGIPDSKTFDDMQEFIELNIDHLRNHREPQLRHLATLWQQRRIGKDQFLQCMALFDEMAAKNSTKTHGW